MKLSAPTAALLMLLSTAGPAAAQPPAAPAPTTASPTVAAANAANLNISPKRVTLDRNHRSGTIFVFNQGTGPGTFDISLVDRIMLPNGRILTVEEAQADPATKAVADKVKSAQPILQISPRRTTLKPGEGQLIRLQVVGGANVEPAEYRTHLTIATLPPRDAGTTAEEAASSTTASGLSIRITALFGLSVPVIVRLSDLDVRAGFENPRLTYEDLGGPGHAPRPKSPVLTLDLVRQGAGSLFGSLEVRIQGQPRSAPIGVVHGLGVYPEIDRRTVQVVLTRAPAPGEKIELTFTDDDTSPGKLLAKLVL